MERIEVSTIETGIRFSKPVYFDDGKNMFIESGITVKPYHLNALAKWRIPFLLSDGHIMAEDEELIEEPEELADAEEMVEEELSEIEDLEEPEDLSVEDLQDAGDLADAADFLEEL